MGRHSAPARQVFRNRRHREIIAVLSVLVFLLVFASVSMLLVTGVLQ